MRNQAKPLILVAMMLFGAVSPGRSEDCVCRLHPGPVEVSNFPEVQTVSVRRDDLPLEIRDVGLTRVHTQAMELGKGERRPLGPFSLDGRRRVTLQISQSYPRTGTPIPLRVRWLVRFDEEDAFFDPCGPAPAGAVCVFGLPADGMKMVPLLPPVVGDEVEGIQLTGKSATIATFEPVGTEGLLLIENDQAGPRTLRVQLVLDR